MTPEKQAEKPKTSGQPKPVDKRTAFVRLAEPRVSGVLDRLDTLGKLARPAAYEYTDADVAAMENAVTSKVKEIFDTFRNPSAKKHEPTFRL